MHFKYFRYLWVMATNEETFIVDVGVVEPPGWSFYVFLWLLYLTLSKNGKRQLNAYHFLPS